MEQKFGKNSIDIKVLREFCEREGKEVTYHRDDSLFHSSGQSDELRDYRQDYGCSLGVCLREDRCRTSSSWPAV